MHNKCMGLCGNLAVQCINIGGFKPNLAGWSDKKVWAAIINSLFAP